MTYSSDAVLMEHQGVIALVNPACLTLFGARTESELTGKSLYELVHPDFRERVRSRVTGLLSDGQPALPVEVKILRMDGVSVDVEVVAALVKDIHFVLHKTGILDPQKGTGSQ